MSKLGPFSHFPFPFHPGEVRRETDGTTHKLYITTIGPERRSDLQDKLSIKSASQPPLWCMPDIARSTLRMARRWHGDSHDDGEPQEASKTNREEDSELCQIV